MIKSHYVFKMTSPGPEKYLRHNYDFFLTKTTTTLYQMSDFAVSRGVIILINKMSKQCLCRTM